MTFEITLATLLFVAMNTVIGLGWWFVYRNRSEAGDSFVGQGIAKSINGVANVIMFLISLLLYAVYGGIYWF